MESKMMDSLGVTIDNSSDNSDSDASNAEESTNIVEATQEYFFADEGFADDFEEWCKENAHQIDLEKEECCLHYTKLYKQFLRRFETKLSDFIESQGYTVEEFYEELRKATQEPDGDMFAQILNATTDFDVFLTMMKEVAAAQKYEEETKAQVSMDHHK